MHEGVLKYIEHGIRPGGFLSSLFEGDIASARSYADEANLAHLPVWQDYMHSSMPAASHGSASAVNTWIAGGGLRGRGLIVATLSVSAQNSTIDSILALLDDGLAYAKSGDWEHVLANLESSLALAKTLAPSPPADTVVLSEQVKQKTAEDPGLAEVVRMFSVAARQASEMVKRGEYSDIPSAMEALGFHSEPIDIDSDPNREEILEALGDEVDVHIESIEKKEEEKPQ